MQFFIINSNPVENAKMLPDYTIKRVNVREGWQMLSDIGHNLGVNWKGQNKPYSIWHAETRKFMVDQPHFKDFCTHYAACLEEYRNRSEGKETVFHSKFRSYECQKAIKYIFNELPKCRTQEEFMRDYLVSAKSDKMTEDEIYRIMRLED